MEKVFGSFVLVGLVLPWYFTQRATGSMVAGFSAGLGGLFVTVLVLLWLSVQRDRCRAALQRWRDRTFLASGMAVIDRMSGVQFEEFIAAQLRAAGWHVTPTATTGDYGVDLIARKDATRMAVQCKRQAKAVGVAAVQQVVSGAKHHGCDRTVVVTNQAFTKAARQLAITHRCRLVGRTDVHTWTRATPVRPPAGRQRVVPERDA